MNKERAQLLLTVPDMYGHEVVPGVTLIGTPKPIPGTDRFSCLANYYGSTALIELKIRFGDQPHEQAHPHPPTPSTTYDT